MKHCFKNLGRSGIALATVLILVIVLTLIAASMLTLLSNQVSLIEHDNFRTKSRYAEEAAMVRNLEKRRRGEDPDDTWQVGDIIVDIDWSAGGGINNTDQLNFTHDYSVTF